MHPAVAQLVADAGDWESSGSAEAILQLSLVLEMHNRPGNWNIYEEYLPLSLRLVDLTDADQAEVVQALDRLIRDAPTEVARCSLLSAMASALPSMAMAPALRLLMDPPEGFTAGPTWERVLFVVDHLLDFTSVPADDPRRAALAGVAAMLEAAAPETKLAADGPMLESDRATSILRALARWRGIEYQERIPSYAGGEPLEALLAGLDDADPGQRRRALAALPQGDFEAQRHVVRALERQLRRDDRPGGRAAVLEALRKADLSLVLNLPLWGLADNFTDGWDSDDVVALLVVLDDLLRRAAADPEHDAWFVHRAAVFAQPTLEALAGAAAARVCERATTVLETLRSFPSEQ